MLSLLALSLSVDLVGTWAGKRVAALPPNATEAQRATSLMKAEAGGKGDVTLVLAKDRTATVRFKGPSGRWVANKGKWSQKGLHLIIVAKPMKPSVMIADADGKKLVAWGERGETSVVFRRIGS